MTKTRVNTGFDVNQNSSDSSSEPVPIREQESELFGKRLEVALDGESVSSFSRRCGISDSLLGAYIRGDKSPGLERLVAIANTLGVTVDWLATGRPPKKRSDLASIIDIDEAHYVVPGAISPLKLEELRQAYGGGAPIGYTAVPLYSGVIASAGHGANNGREHADDCLMFKEDWLRSEFGARPQDLWMICVHGDSMEPTLRSGEIILVDSRASRPDREGIYILRLGEALLVKRLQVMPGRKIRVTSDNAAFEPWIIDLDEACSDIAIVGRVVWSGRRM